MATAIHHKTGGSGQVLLSIENLKVAYGGIQAVKGVTLEVREGELVSLIGANGGHGHAAHRRW
jgi:ABC-type branched-subunit amino acid transport system ATPase component